MRFPRPVSRGRAPCFAAHAALHRRVTGGLGLYELMQLAAELRAEPVWEVPIAFTYKQPVVDVRSSWSEDDEEGGDKQGVGKWRSGAVGRGGRLLIEGRKID